METILDSVSIQSTAQALFFFGSLVGIVISGIVGWGKSGEKWDWLYANDWIVAALTSYPLTVGVISPTAEHLPALAMGFISGLLFKDGASGVRKLFTARQSAEKSFMRAGRKLLQNSGRTILNQKIDEIIENAR